ncbi:hypothetical protein [Streptomyces sp. SID8358]|uniref:TetR/AcrR family transcriptional regulator n=1 Tax=Streptomyces sp. SID8358 TaxID=2690342 RepID=UPI0031F87160
MRRPGLRQDVGPRHRQGGGRRRRPRPPLLLGTKDEVFAAAVELSFEPALVLPEVLGGPAEDLGERLARYFIGVRENPVSQGPCWRSCARRSPTRRRRTCCAASCCAGLLDRIAADLDVPDPALRAELAASHMIGTAVLRYVVRAEPLASADPEGIVAMVAPTLQRYLADR